MDRNEFVSTLRAALTGEVAPAVVEDNVRYYQNYISQEIASGKSEKEVLEETGCTVSAQRLIAVQDWRRHNVTNYAYGVVKIFVLCRYMGGWFRENIETTEAGLFGIGEIPDGLAVEKCTGAQIRMCFEALRNPNAPTIFD